MVRWRRFHDDGITLLRLLDAGLPFHPAKPLFTHWRGNGASWLNPAPAVAARKTHPPATAPAQPITARLRLNPRLW